MDAILWLPGLHAPVGLFYHCALKDGVLDSLLPRSFQVSRARRD